MARKEQIESLEQAVTRLDQTAADIHSALRRRTQVFVLTILVVAIVASVLLGILYRTTLDNRAAIEQNNRQFCDLVAQSASLSPPPSTPRGQSLQASSQRLFKHLGCDNPDTTPSLGGMK